jgi:excisionase family DNA binding protein
MRTPQKLICAPEMPDGERMFRIKDVADLLRVSDKTVRRLIDEGKLPALKLRGLLLIRWTDLETLVKRSA